MREFTKVDRSFWETDEARDMTPEEKYFWMYLQTNANVNTLGCYPFRMRKAVDETGYNKETIEKLLDRMAGLGKIRFDKKTMEVFLLDFPANSWSKKTAVVRALKGDLKEIKSDIFKEMLTKLLKKAGFFAEEQEGTTGNNEEQEGTTGNNRGEEEEEEEEKEEEKILTGKSDAFAVFWSAYPNKKNKQTAIKKWNALKVTPELFKQIMDGLERAKKSKEWTKDGGEYIPHPATWLNAGGWENEYTEAVPPGANGQAYSGAPESRQEDVPSKRRAMLGG